MLHKRKTPEAIQKVWVTPSIKVMSTPSDESQTVYYNGTEIAKVITACGVPCELVKQVAAPQVATYHFKLNNVLQITQLKKPLAVVSARVHSSVKQIASRSGDFALEIPTVKRKTVTIQECMLTKTFNEYDRTLRTCLGCSCDNESVVLSVGKMPHILIAGATGSGKSVLLNSMIISLLYSETPATLRFVMIDPKKVELSKYEGLPHLDCPIVKDHASAVATLEAVCNEMDRRYNVMAAQGFKKASDMGLPSIVVVIDELADLMLTSKYECEQSIIRIAQLGRAAGIHLIIATQRPTVNVITGLIKSNIPCKIALQTSSIRDSITILDHKGAETLTGMGDALLKLPSQVSEIRFQSAYINDSDIERVVDYWKYNAIK